MSRMKGKKTQTHIQGQQKQVLEQMYSYNIFRLLIGVPDYSSSESYGEKQKLILVGFIVISRKIRTHLDLLTIPRLWGKKYLGTTKASTRMILVRVQMYNIFRLLIGVPDYSSSELYVGKQKLIGFIVIISLFHRGVSVNHISH